MRNLFYLIKNSSDRIGIIFQNSDRNGLGLDKFGSDFNRQLSDYKHPIRCTPLVYCQYFKGILFK